MKKLVFSLAFLLLGDNICPFMESQTSMLTQLLDLVAWVKAHLKQVILGTGIVIGVAIVVTVFVYNRAQRELRASEALSNIKTPLNPTEPLPPGIAEEYLKVATEYPGTKAAVRALLDAGGAYYVQGKYAESEKQFQRLLRDYPETPWRAEAVYGEAANLAALGKTTGLRRDP